MNSTSDSLNGEDRSREAHASLRLAVVGMMLSVVVVGAGIVGTLLWQRDRDGSGKMAPSQSEPDLVAESDVVPQPAAVERHVKLVVHEDRTPDAEQIDADLDKLALAEAAAASP